MKCLIIDDDPSIRLILKSLIQKVDKLDLSGECALTTEAFNHIQKAKPDLIFLDIEMPGLNGIEFLESMQEKPLIIVCTSKRDYAVEAYELEAVDYIVKPITEKRFLAAVSKAITLFDQQQKIIDSNPEYIFIKDKNVLTKVKYADILFIQAMGDYMKIITEHKGYILHSTMKALENILPTSTFFRTHRSFIINLNHLEQIEDNVASIRKHPIPIGDQYRQSLLTRLNPL